MSEMDKIQRYIRNTKIQEALSDRCSLEVEELLAIVRGCKKNAHAAAMLAFSYGTAKGYRAAKAEHKKEAQHEQD